MSASGRRGACVTLGLVMLCLAGTAEGSHNGPTRAEVLGLDARTRRIYFAQFDESEVAYAPQLWFFDLGSRQARTARHVSGPLYPGEPGTPGFEARIDSLRAALVRPMPADTAEFVLRVRTSTLPDSVNLDDPDERASRFDLRGVVSGSGLVGDFHGVGFFDPWVTKVSAWRFPALEAAIVTVSWQGVWIGSGDEFETCVLLTRAAGRPGARPK